MVDRRRWRSEHGFATFWALGWMGVCLTLGEVSLLAAAAVAAQHHLDGAADLAALAAADHLQSGGSPCAAASTTAHDNAVELITCSLRGSDVEVTVGTLLHLLPAISVNLRSAARAGPG